MPVPFLDPRAGMQTSRKYTAPPFGNTYYFNAIDRALKLNMVYLVMFRRYDYNARPGIHEIGRGTFVVRAATGSKPEIRRRAAEYLQIPEIDVTVL